MTETMYVYSHSSEEILIAKSVGDIAQHRKKTVVRFYGITTSGQTHCWQTIGYGVSVRLSLPPDVDWAHLDQDGRQHRLESLWDLMLRKGCRHYPSRDRHRPHVPFDEDCQYNCWLPMMVQHPPPLDFRRRLYHAQVQWNPATQKYDPRLEPYITVRFHHQAAMRHFVRAITEKDLVHAEMGALRLRAFEDEAALTPVLKMLSDQQLPFVGWCHRRSPSPSSTLTVSTAAEIEHRPVVLDRAREPLADTVLQNRCLDQTSFATLDYSEVHALDPNLTTADARLAVPEPRVMAFDLETYSSVTGAFPDAANPDDVIFQISCVLADGPDLSKIRRVLLSLKAPDPLHPDLAGERIEVRAFASEYELLMGFAALINEWNPHVVVGYNVFGYDWPYLIARAEWHCRCYSEFAKFAMRPNLTCPVQKKSGNSKFQEMTYIEADGRVMVDMLPLIKREHNLESYKLKAVAQLFLNDPSRPDVDVAKDPLTVQGIFRCFEEGTPESMARVGRYCVQDSVLVVMLWYKLKCWPGLCETANVSHVPISYGIARGEQIKVLFAVFRFAHAHGFVVDRPASSNGRDHDQDQEPPPQKYTGAQVLDPVVGLHAHGVLSFDFASLYPSIMRAYNIDFSSLLADANDPCVVDRAHTHNLEWEEHVNCEHDPSFVRGRKLPKSARVICEKYAFRFLRAEFSATGQGVLPTILNGLLGARKVARKEEERLKGLLEEEEKGSQFWSADERAAMQSLASVFEKRQLAFKVSANSLYGALGASRGFLPFRAAAMCITYLGRSSIAKVVRFLESAPYYGRVVYGDTDSAFATFPRITDHCMLSTEALREDDEAARTLQRLGGEISRASESLFPAPMKLEFEGKVYLQFLLLTKKRYIGQIAGKASLYFKGIVMKRRDNCRVLRDWYGALMDGIFLHRWGFHRCLEHLALTCARRMLARGGYPLRDFVVTKELTAEPGQYATKPAHAVLAERMRARGQPVAVGTRLEFVFVARGRGAKQDEKIEDVDYVEQYREWLPLDIFYYWETQLRLPLNELLTVAFPKETGRSGGDPLGDWLAERRAYASCVQRIKQAGPHRTVRPSYGEEPPEGRQTVLRSFFARAPAAAAARDPAPGAMVFKRQRTMTSAVAWGRWSQW